MSRTIPPTTPRRLCALLAGLLTAPLVAAQAPTAASAPPTGAPLTACMADLRPAAAAAGVNADTWRRHTAGLLSDPVVIERLNFQPEFRIPVWDYLAALVDDERVADGQARLAAQAEVLRAVEQRHGVDPATVVAVWGVESNFGQGLGGLPILRSLATLSCEGRRQAYFRTEFFAALRIVQAGHFPAERFNGSWAGAFGHTQFMPSTFERLAVDFDGDGRADLFDSTADALASTANFLQRAGWRPGVPWGFEVRLPAGFSTAGEGRRTKRPGSDWRARGLQRVDGQPIPDELSLGLMTPAGPQGPAFLVSRNFDALYSYNAAESYGLAIAHLADRLRGGGGFATPWPTDDPGLSRAERRELQTLLAARGHDIGAIDGLLGERTRAAVRVEQARLGLTTDGRAGQRLLRALRGG